MSDSRYHIGQRLSLKSQACTVRYVGPVYDKPGQWLGVEWDNGDRGKHDGSHDGTRYFSCRSSSPTAASFLRPEQDWDRSRTFLEALSNKYFRIEDARSEDVVFVSRSKQIEKIGFEKFAQRQAELRGIHVLVLDRMQIRHSDGSSQDKAIASICANITDLDIGGNLFETLHEILMLCSHFPKLKRLTLDGNRLTLNLQTAQQPCFEQIRTLSLSNTFLTCSEIEYCLVPFPQVEEVHAAANGLSSWTSANLPHSIRSFDLAQNQFQILDHLRLLLKLESLKTLNLKQNQITNVAKSQSISFPLSTTLEDIDLSQNSISSWQLFDTLDHALPAVRHLRVSNNPVYASLRSADLQPLAAADGYMLTIARLPNLETLNYSKITDQVRLNAEKYYQGQIATELSRTSEAEELAILRRHPRWQALCEEYGTPNISREVSKDAIDPNSLAARLVEVEFRLAEHILPSNKDRSWNQEIPKAFSIYALYGIVGKRLKQMPLTLRLIWETGERDPVAISIDQAEYWDSSDEEDSDATQWTLREIELVPGTRAIATYLDGRSANIRIEVRG